MKCKKCKGESWEILRGKDLSEWRCLFCGNIQINRNYKEKKK